MANRRETFCSLWVDKHDLSRVRWELAPPIGEGELAAGQVAVRIVKFAFTANNITYARLGTRSPGITFGYWDFFPVAEGWGQIPVWGIGEVAASRYPQLARGERLYGFFPMAPQLVMAPGPVEGARVVDGTAHRRTLSANYNEYVLVGREPVFDRGSEDAYMILRPGFSLSFCCSAFLNEMNGFGAGRVVISSASSKAALGLAMLLAEDSDDLEVVGLTSAGRTGEGAWQEVYDRLLTYDQAGMVGDGMPTVFVDIANSDVVAQEIHERLGGALKASLIAGFTQAPPSSRVPLPGPRRQLFSAPAHMLRLRAEWGDAVYWRKYGEAWRRFHGFTQPWLAIERTHGPEGVERVYREVLAGGTPTDRCHILSLSTEGDQADVTG